MPARVACLAVVLIICSACADADQPPRNGVDGDTAAIAPDTRGMDGAADDTTSAERATASSRLEETLRNVVSGTGPMSRDSSWFSDATAGVLISAQVDSAGHAIVDFRDLRPLIGNASSSAGSAMLVAELNRAVFSVPDVRSVEYRMEGSCDLFWEWLQYGCHIEERPG